MVNSEGDIKNFFIKNINLVGITYDCTYLCAVE